jgi:hypothetical protein
VTGHEKHSSLLRYGRKGFMLLKPEILITTVRVFTVKIHVALITNVKCFDV